MELPTCNETFMILIVKDWRDFVWAVRGRVLIGVCFLGARFLSVHGEFDGSIIMSLLIILLYHESNVKPPCHRLC